MNCSHFVIDRLPFVTANDEGLTLETSASLSPHGGNFTLINFFDTQFYFYWQLFGISFVFFSSYCVQLQLARMPFYKGSNFNQSTYIHIKAKTHTNHRSNERQELILISITWSNLWCFCSPPPGGDVSPSQGHPQKYFAGTHLYTWVEKDDVKVSCAGKQHDMTRQTPGCDLKPYNQSTKPPHFHNIC